LRCEWMRPLFLSLVERSLQGIVPDPGRFLDALKRAVDQVRAGRNPLDDGGLVALLAGDEQHAALQQVQGLMSLLEGHGDVTMNRAGADRVPDAERFHRTLHERRKQATPAAKLLQKLVGLDAKLKQYEQGERFIAAVEAEGGPALFNRIWEAPDRLPTLEEIRHPERWLARVRTLEVSSSVT
jgi:putative hydrolase